MPWNLRSILPVWLLALVGAVAVPLLVGKAYLTWMPVAMGVALLTAMVVQLSLQRKEGLVLRLASSTVGAAFILFCATIVLLIVMPSGLKLI